jgi:ribonuclease G
LLPGESLAKYRGKPAGALPVAEPEQAPAETQEQVSEEFSPRASAAPAVSGPGSNVPRRSSGGLPRWLLADAGAETDTSSTGMEEIGETAADTSSASQHVVEEQAAEGVTEVPGIEAPLSEEEAVVLSTALVEAKHEETQAEAEADSLAGGAEFGEEEVDEEAEEVQEIAGSESEAIHVVEEEELVEEEIDDEEESEEASAESDADAAHEAALREVAADGPSELHLPEHSEPVEATASERTEGDVPKQEEFLLPGETRSSTRSGEGQGERQEYPRESARIGGGNPRARFQRPYRGGGRDRGRDNRGGRPDRRGGRPGGHRFDRRPGGGGGGPQRGHGHHHGGHSGPSRRPQLISEMLKAGQDVVVQIAKEPLGKKGARITSHIALPGRFLVYMPTIDHIGVSRKIASAENRSRLRRLVGEARGSYPGGFIVRTAAGGASDDEIRADIEFLGRSWNEIKERNEQRKAPALLHRDLNLVERILRDYVSDDFTGIWIDNEEEYGKIVEFVSRFQPKLISKVKLYSKEMPIFEEFGIQHELDKALRAKVWLKSGGYIVINHTEALVAIDVNTGKFVGKGSTRLEDTIVKTNLEAVKEIVRQIRLRDLGGIIVVDFIDMEERRNREKVLSALQMALEQDKAPSKALSFNEFGLVCITRKRTKQALERVLCQPCPYCTGSGMVKSVPTLCYEIQAEARKMAIADHENPNLTLRVHPEIAKALKTRESMLIDELEQNSHKHVIIQSDATLHWEQYDIY